MLLGREGIVQHADNYKSLASIAYKKEYYQYLVYNDD